MNKTFIRLLAALIILGIPGGGRAFDGVQPASHEDQQPAGSAPAPANVPVDLQSRPLDWIPPGTVIGDAAPQGWTNLVLIGTSRLGVGDVEAVPRTAVKYSSMFHFTVLANVRPGRRGNAQAYVLDRVAIGSALEINGKKVIATSDQTFGYDLGFIGSKVMQENENILRTDVRQVVRTPTMMIFDAQGFVRYNHKHARMITRHVVVVSPRDGRLATFVWLMGSDGRGGYALAEPALQMLPPNMHEDRVLSVDANKFTLGIPSNDAFALAHIPQGTAIKYTPELSRLAIVRRFTPETALQLEEELQDRYVPIAAASNRNANGARR
jgi:hypothetical protein